MSRSPRNQARKPRPMCEPCKRGEHDKCAGEMCGCWQARAVHWPKRDRKGRPRAD